MYSSIYIGDKIDLSKFQKVKELGRGSFGVTFLYQRGNTKYAVKKLGGKLSTGISNEVNILKKLHRCATENVLCFKQIDTYGKNKIQIITEYIDGYTLSKFFEVMLDIDSSLKYKKITSGLINQAFNGLKYLHSLGIIHSDIKPDNIMVDSEGTLKLIDFGLSSVKDSQNRIVVRGGTDYFTPEYKRRRFNRGQWIFTFSEEKVADLFSLVKSFITGYDGTEPISVLIHLDKSYPGYFTDISDFTYKAMEYYFSTDKKPDIRLYNNLINYDFPRYTADTRINVVRTISKHHRDGIFSV